MSIKTIKFESKENSMMVPSFTLLIKNNRKVYYTGIDNVKIKGEYAWKISRSSLKMLGEIIDSSGFNKLRKKYIINPRRKDHGNYYDSYTGLPIMEVIKITIEYFGGSCKTVFCEMKAWNVPGLIRLLKKQILEISGVKVYI